jgi:hypothetical protein
MVEPTGRPHPSLRAPKGRGSLHWTSAETGPWFRWVSRAEKPARLSIPTEIDTQPFNICA